MTTKCTGIMGLIFGHKWNEEATVVNASLKERGVFYLHGIGPLKVIMVEKCQRCGAVTGEKK